MDKNIGITVKKLSLVVVGMFGFGFAMVPIYDALCDTLGLNGKTGKLAEAEALKTAKPDKNRLISVQFVANKNGGMPWEFHPGVSQMKVHPGELNKTTFWVKNPTGRDILGQAVPSLAPGEAAKYFNKTECFCFTEQFVKSGEQKDMPIHFIIDSRIPAHITTVTLSYTFFEKKNRGDVAKR